MRIQPINRSEHVFRCGFNDGNSIPPQLAVYSDYSEQFIIYRTFDGITPDTRKTDFTGSVDSVLLVREPRLLLVGEVNVQIIVVELGVRNIRRDIFETLPQSGNAVPGGFERPEQVLLPCFIDVQTPVEK